MLKAASSYLFLVIILTGCASKRRVEELTAEIKQNQSEIAQLKVEQEKILQSATKVALGLNDLVAIAKKTDSATSDNKKQLEDHSLKINELKQELSTIQKANEKSLSNSLTKALVTNGVTLPDGSFIANDASRPVKTSLKAENKSATGNVKPHVPTSLERALDPAYHTNEYQESYMQSPRIDFIDWYKRMLPLGTTQDRVFQVMGKPDQVNFSGAWVYGGIVRRDDDKTKTTYLKITFSDNGEVVGVE